MEKTSAPQGTIADKAADEAKPEIAKAPKYETAILPCAALFGDCGPVIASAKGLGLSTKLGARLAAFKPKDAGSWTGFFIDVPFAKGQASNEARGFGVCHKSDRTKDDRVLVVDRYEIEVRFPRGAFEITVMAAPEEIASGYPEAKGRDKGLTLITVRLGDRPVQVGGFGVPFANADDPEVEGWINDNKPIVDGHTLLDFLQQEVFSFVVAMAAVEAAKKLDPERLPPPFAYDYGIFSGWDVRGFKDLIEANKGHQFAPAFKHFDDNSHLTAVAQSAAQDIMWLDDEADKIAGSKFPAYFIPLESGDLVDVKRFHVVISVTKLFRDEHDAAWRRFSKSDFLELRLFGSHEAEKSHSLWPAKIVGFPQGKDELAKHPVGDYELVVTTNRPGPLEECKRKVQSVGLFRPCILPSNIGACGLPVTRDGVLPDNLTNEQERLLHEVQDRMDLHRALLRGDGFYKWMVKPVPRDVVEAHGDASLDDKAPKIRPLPRVNFLDLDDQAYADAIVEEALPTDRLRFRNYLSDRPLGLGLITAGPGFGKTTAGAAATLAMHAKVGKVLASGPTNVAVDNFAARIDKRAQAVVARCNKDRPAQDLTRRRHPLVVRAYNPNHENSALISLLQNPHYGDEAAPTSFWSEPSKWKLNLSCASWVLVLLRSPAAKRVLHPDDCQLLHDLQQALDDRADLAPLREVATGAISWQDFKACEGSARMLEVVGAYISRITDCADILCITPAASANKSFKEWKSDKAEGVAIDEAANMHRADLYCVWGNTLLPCFLFGDPKQLPPVIMTFTDKEKGSENFVNRFAKDGRVSALGYIQGGGFPVYRLKTQLRMAQGMFDTVARIIYPDVPFTYAPSRAIGGPEFQVGRDLEAFAWTKFPDLKQAPTGTLKPFFIHCEGSRVIKDPVTSSKRSPDQVKVALNFAAEFVTAKKVDPSRLSVIAPYAANVQVINSWRKKPEYAVLAGMGQAMTVDSFQGQENDIAIVVMGTSTSSGCGFTADAQRLNVLLTRQKCGLVVVGDIYVAKSFEKGNGKGKGKGKGKSRGPKGVEMVELPSGEMAYVRVSELNQIYQDLHDSGRMAVVVVGKTEAEKPKTTNKAKEEKVGEKPST
ncbi:hypothetical protein FDECE_13760 [Fusarium decemcellulare]|nr:hypothetical protein FDECE_13760 [Fusarium decemcellulare]